MSLIIWVNTDTQDTQGYRECYRESYRERF